MSLICLVTAMTAEAKPLVEAFNLKAFPQRGLSAWMGDGVCLVQTGMGAQRAAARIESLLSVQVGIDAFINVGVAGGDRELGDVIIASSLLDQVSQRRWYPHLPASSVIDATNHCEVVTVTEPCRDYRNDCVYDMEAASVAKVATQHTDLSRIHAVKVISDNPSHSVEDFCVKNVTPWMLNTLPTVEALIECLSTNKHRHEVVDFRANVQSLTDHITSVCHHSVTQSHQLRRLLERYLATHGHLPHIEQMGRLDSSQQLLQKLENELTSLSVIY